MINDYVAETEIHISTVFPESAPTTEASPTAIPMSLDEFCRDFSKTERRVTLLGAFHFEMKRQKRFTDTDSNYRAAFAAFITAPA